MVVGSSPTSSNRVWGVPLYQRKTLHCVSKKIETCEGRQIFCLPSTLFCCAIFLFASFGDCFAAQTGRREHFLSVGPGSAGAALGDALIAKGVDSSAGFYNPATLVGQPSGAFFEYASPNTNATRNWLATAVGDRRLKGALLWKNETLPLSSSRNGLLLSAGISEKLLPLMPQGTSLGLTFGYVSQKITNYVAGSALANIGFAWNKVGRKFHYGAGATVNNIYFSGLQFRPEGEKEIWPRELNLGGFMSRWGITFFGSALVSNKMYPAFGAQYSPFSARGGSVFGGNFMELRAGYNTHPRIGIGFEVRRFKLDYAMRISEIQNAHSISLGYIWGKELPEKDYTDPLNELKAKYDALSESILQEIRLKVKNGEMPQLKETFKLLAVDLNSEDGWSFFETLGGGKRFKMRMPFGRKAKRLFLEFAVAYANDAPNALDLGKEFFRRYKDTSVSKLVNLILERGLND